MPPIYVGDVLVSAGTGGTPPTPTPTVTLAVAPSSALEDGATNIVYTFTRTGATDAALTVNYTIGGTATNGTDYATIGTSVVIPIGSATATVTINPTTDATIEGDETVSLTLASGSYTIGTVSAVTSTITNDDVAPSLPTVTLAVAPSSALEDGGTNIVYTFTRTGSTAAPLTVNYTIGGTATNGTDYATIGTSVVIAGGSATGTVTIDPTLDATIESDETVTLTLAADAAYTVGTGGAVTATITNDDFAPGLPTVTVARTPASVLEDGAPTMTFTFTRTGSTAGSLVVDYTISGTAVNGTDYLTIPSSITIAGGSATGTVVIDPTADATIEADETVILSIASSANYTVGAPSTATGTITNDDFPTVTIARSSGNPLEDGAGNMVFTVTRTGSTAAALTVNFTIGGTAINGTDYATVAPSVLIPIGSATADIVVNPTVDALLEGNETVTLTLAADPAYTIGAPASAIGLILNDETGSNVFAFASSDTVIVSEAAGTATLTVARAGSTAAAATLEYTISAVSGGATPVDDYTPVTQLAANLGQVEFAIGEATATITVPIVNDVTTEGVEAFSLGIQNPSNGSLGAPRTAVVRIVDNDGASRISFADTAYEVAETAGSLTVTLIRAGSTAAAASVTLATTAGTAVPGIHYTTTSATVTFPIGSSTQTVSIPILDAVDPYNFVTLTLGLSAVSGATIDGSATASVQILGPGIDFAGATVATFTGGFTEPVTMEWLPGDPTTMLVAEKAGLVRVVQNGILRTAPLVDRTAVVNNIVDRGMIGLAVHPSWPAQPYVYIVYNYDPPETIGAGGLSAPDGGGNRPARVERLTVDPGTLLATSGTVIVGTNSTWAFTSRPDLNSTGDISILPSGIVNGTTITASAADISTGYQDNSPDQAGVQNQNIRDYITTDSQSHGISNLEFGPDGMLYVAVGDGASFNFIDPRAVRCQDIGNLSGKLLRVDPITGNGVVGNPYYSEASGTPPGTSNQSKVFYYGLRNAFRFTFDPVTQLPLLGDVGYGTWEEINTGPAGSNFGWPYREGTVSTPGYGTLPQAVAFAANGQINAGSPNPLPAVVPLRQFSHSAPDNFNSITMGQFYNANSFAYADLIDGRVFTGTLNAGRTAITPTQIATGLEYLTDLRAGPDGNLYGCQIYGPGFGPGRIIRWTLPQGVVTVTRAPASAVEDAAPNIVFTFTRTGSTVAPLTVNYTISGSATNGTDYATIGTSVVIPGGSASATVTIDPTPDAITETGGETVTLTVNASANYTVGSPAAATGTIIEPGGSVFPTPTMYLQLVDNTLDTSPNAFVPTGTPTPFRLTDPAPPIAAAFYQFDWNGGDALRYADTALLNPGTGDFTISAFVRQNFVTGVDEFPSWFSKGAFQSSTGAMAFFRNRTAGRFGIGFSNPWREAQGATDTGPGDTWFRITVVRSGATITLYQGTTVRGTVSATGLDLTSTHPFIVGGSLSDGAANWQGGICDFVYVRGTALTVPQITALQTATYGSLL
jgi:glucose/arabinose dehydrogenase